MATEIKAPTFPESVQEGSLATWHKQVGETVKRDELLVDIETDKVVLEVVAPAAGVLAEIFKAEGDIVLSNEIIARIEEGAEAAAPSAAAGPLPPLPTSLEIGSALADSGFPPRPLRIDPADPDGPLP